MNNQKLISIRQFAKLVGVDKSTVRFHIQAGKFTNGVSSNLTGNTKMKMPDALNEWKVFKEGSSNPNTQKTENMAQAEYYKAQIAKLDLEEKRNNLVKKEDVFKALFWYGSTLRNELMTIPDAIAPDMIQCEDTEFISKKIKAAIEGALTKIAEDSLLEFDGISINK